MQKLRWMLVLVIFLGIVLVVGYKAVDSTVFFYSPDEVDVSEGKSLGKVMRLGGQVVEGSTSFDEDLLNLHFQIRGAENLQNVAVVFSGVKPDLYREGQGVVVEGVFGEEGVFQASTLLVKHSEEYQVSPEDKGQTYKTLLRGAME